jgi:hypothetical protein
MIKKSMAMILVLGLFLANFGGIVLAQEANSVAPDIAPIIPIPPDTSNSLLFGQKHSYSVVFRGNGEAITYAKLVIPNREEQAFSEFSFEIPEVDPYEMIMYQMKLPLECVRYNYTDPNNPCVEYREPDYGQDYYYYGSGQTAEYNKIKYTKSGNTYNLTLPNPVEPSKSTAIIISYAAKGYVDESFGLYKFNFETIRVNSRIQSTKVAVDVDSDLLLKGKQSSVNYNEGAGNMPMAKLGDSSAISSRELDRVVSNIGISGALIKESKSLAPNESFNVRGEYAKNWFRLYLNEIIITILVIAIIIVLIYLISKHINSKPKKGSDDSRKTQNKEQNIVNKNSIHLFDLTNVLISLGAVIVVIIVSIILRFLNYNNVFQSISYDPTFSSLISVIITLLYSLILLAPAIMVGLRKGWGNLLSIIILQFIWFMIILALYLLFFQSGLTEIMPMPRPVAY